MSTKGRNWFLVFIGLALWSVAADSSADFAYDGQIPDSDPLPVTEELLIGGKSFDTQAFDARNFASGTVDPLPDSYPQTPDSASGSDSFLDSLGNDADAPMPFVVDRAAGVVRFDESLLDDGINWLPNWNVAVGAVFLRRDDGGSRPLSNGNSPLDAGTLGFRFDGGPSLRILRRRVLQSAWDLELSYFGVNEFDAYGHSANASTLFTSPPIVFAPQLLAAKYQSRLDSTEINLRRCNNGWLTWLGGFRWIEVGEQLETSFVGAAHTINTNNHLYGFQFGVDSVLFTRPVFTIEAWGKAGVYYNSADQSTNITNIAGTIPRFSASSSETAFVGDLGILGTYTLNPLWRLRGGYQVLFVDRLALASDQYASSNVTTGSATLDTGNTAVYHGFTAALEFVW